MKRPQYLITTTELSLLSGVSENKIRKTFVQDIIKLPGRKLGLPSNKVKPFLKKNGFDYSFQTTAFINLKGGIGKTTSCVTIASRFVQYGYKTCILDMDSQGSASLSFDKMPAEDEPVFCDIWQNPEEMLMGALKKIDHNFYILPSSLENGLLDLQLVNPISQKNAVAKICNVLAENGFDQVFIDCPPSLGTAVISTICASDSIVIPVTSDAFSFQGLRLSLSEITSITDVFNLDKPIIKIIFTKFDKRYTLARKSLEQLETDFQELGPTSIIRTSSEFSKALDKNETIFYSHKKSSAKQDFDYIVNELLDIKKERVK
jgi:chromosome partitioning protein